MNRALDNTINTNNVLQNAVDINNANGLPLIINSDQYNENNCSISNPSSIWMGRQEQNYAYGKSNRLDINGS